MLRFLLIVCILFLIVIMPSTVFADAIVPVFQFFTPVLFVPSLILLVLIILVEAVLLKLLIKPIRFQTHLLYSTIINTVSSIAGSFLGFINYSFVLSEFYWSSLFITLSLPFIVTFASEYPVILLLYKKTISAKKAVWINLKINVASYFVFIILVSPVFLTGVMKISEYKDNKRLLEWSHSEILQNESGKIYTLNKYKQRKQYEFRNYDLMTKKWESLNQFKIDGYGDFFPAMAWDVSRSFMAYPVDFNLVVIYKKDGFEEICKIPAKCDRLKISRSEQQIAILNSLGEIIVQKEGKDWYQTFGRNCKLEIFDIQSGQQVSKYDKFILADGLDWSVDSKRLLFVSIHDSNHLQPENERIQNSWDKNLTLKEFYPKVIYVYDIDTNFAAELCEGENPQWNNNGTEILFMKDKEIFSYNIATREIKSICKNGTKDRFTWSASGQNVIGLIGTYNPMWTNKYFLTVINVRNPELKYIIDTGRDYNGFVWCED